MSTDLPSDDGANPQTPFALAYGDASRVAATEDHADVILAGETHRSRVRLQGKVKDPLQLRESLAALYAVVASDYRYKPKDKAGYAAYLRMKKESSHLGVWQAQQAYFSWLHRNDPLAAFILDPVITVHPDRVLCEVFSKDESTYANLSIDRAMLDLTAEPTCGTTNIDFSQQLFDGVQQMRGYRETTLHIGGGGVQVATQGTSTIIEKKINVPDSWLRGFLQVQSAATLPMESFRLSAMDLYNVLRELRMHADQKGKRRGLRVELVPGEAPRLVLEPWETVFHGTAGNYVGKAARVVRLWGRRRLMLMRRVLPYVQTVDVHVMGSGLPSFWVFRGPGITLTFGLSGFTSANWSQAVTFDLLLPRKSQGSEPLAAIVRYLEDDEWFATAQEIGKQTKLKGPALLEALQAGCQQGKLMYDLAAGVYRLRPLTDEPLDLSKLEFRNLREKQAYDLIARKDAVELVSENRIPGSGVEIVGKATVAEDGRDYRPQMLLGDEGNVLKAECTCNLFRKQGLKAGPCSHLIALRLAVAKRDAEKAKGVEARQLITVETKSFTRRDAKGEDVCQVSLERARLRIRWGRAGQPLRQQILRFNTIDAARTAYFARVSEMDDKGYLTVTGE